MKLLVLLFVLAAAAVPALAEYTPYEVECANHPQSRIPHKAYWEFPNIIRALRLQCSAQGQLLLPLDLLQDLTVESVLTSLHLVCWCVGRNVYDAQRGKLEDGAMSWILHNIAQKLADTGGQRPAQPEQWVDTFDRKSPLWREILTVPKCRKRRQAQQCADALRLRLGQRTTMSWRSAQAGECSRGLDGRFAEQIQINSPATTEDTRGLMRTPGMRSYLPSQTEIDSFNLGD